MVLDLWSCMGCLGWAYFYFSVTGYECLFFSLLYTVWSYRMYSFYCLLWPCQSNKLFLGISVPRTLSYILRISHPFSDDNILRNNFLKFSMRNEILKSMISELIVFLPLMYLDNPCWLELDYNLFSTECRGRYHWLLLVWDVKFIFKYRNANSVSQ